MDWQQVKSFLFQLGTSLGVKLLGAVFTLVIGLRLIKWIKKLLNRSPRMDTLDVSVRTFLHSFTIVTLYAALFVTVALTLGVPATSFLAVLASCGVAIGLALQGALSNFAGGIMLLIFKPFKVGDYITTPDAAGTVKEITVVYTVLSTPDNKIITVPNGTLTNSVVENYSAMDKRRIDLSFRADYGCDMEQVKALLLQAVTAHPLVLTDPAPMARLGEQGESALNYTVRAWCKTDDYWDVRFDLVEAVKKAFDENGIKVPYPQMDIHLEK